MGSVFTNYDDGNMLEDVLLQVTIMTPLDLK